MRRLEKGILIVVAGHSYYGRMAYCLALSIKARDPDVQIAVVYSGNALNHIGQDQLEFFDHVIKMADDVPANPTCKLYGAKLTPFAQTILLDADTLMLPGQKLSDLFEKLKPFHFTGITEGKEDDPAKQYFWWGNLEEMKSKYSLKVMMHQWRSEFIYYDAEGQKILDRALEIITNHGLDYVMAFASAIPDELGINIAAAEAGVVPHKYKWQPTYWPFMHRNNIPQIAVLGKQYYLISFGSNRASPTMRGVYDIIMKAACYILKRQHVFPLMAKRDFLPKERKLS